MEVITSGYRQNSRFTFDNKDQYKLVEYRQEYVKCLLKYTRNHVCINSPSSICNLSPFGVSCV